MHNFMLVQIGGILELHWTLGAHEGPVRIPTVIDWFYLYFLFTGSQRTTARGFPFVDELMPHKVHFELECHVTETTGEGFGIRNFRVFF